MRFLSVVFCSVFLISAPVFAQDKIKAVTSFTIIADIAQNIAGDVAIVESITKPGAEIHDYQPTPQDIVRVHDADLILWNGLNLERWFERFLQDVSNIPNFVVSEGITPLSIYEGPYSGKPNPHAWMSTDNALIYIENIKNAFIEVDPDNASAYQANADIYAHKITDIKQSLLKLINDIPTDQRYLVTSEGAFSYLAKDMGFKEVYLWPINADQQGTPQQVKKVIDTVRKNNIPVIFSESTVSDRPARQVASETNARYGGVLYVDSLSAPDGAVPTYLDLLRITTQKIADGFLRANKHGDKEKTAHE